MLLYSLNNVLQSRTRSTDGNQETSTSDGNQHPFRVKKIHFVTANLETVARKKFVIGKRL